MTDGLRCLFLVGVLALTGCAESSRPPEPRSEPPAVPEQTEAEQTEAEQTEAEQTPASASPVNAEPWIGTKPRSEGDPVAASLQGPETRLSPGETFLVSVVLDVGSHYEIHPPPALPTRLDLELPNGFEVLGEWSEPNPVRSETPDGHPVHMGQATFQREIRIAENVERGEYDLACSIRYQACNARHCLRPKGFKLSVAVSVLR